MVQKNAKLSRRNFINEPSGGVTELPDQQHGVRSLERDDRRGAGMADHLQLDVAPVGELDFFNAHP